MNPKDSLKEEVSVILDAIAGGADVDYWLDETYIRWGKVEDDLMAAIDRAFEDLFKLVEFDEDGNSVEDVNVVGVHPLSWDRGWGQPTYAFRPADSD